MEVAVRGEDGDISNRIDRENLLRELIKTMSVAGEDAYTPPYQPGVVRAMFRSARDSRLLIVLVVEKRGIPEGDRLR